MGYSLSSIAKLPIDKENEFYIFILGGNANWEGGILQTLFKNFDILAKEIGHNSIIAKGLNPREWSQELSSIYFGENTNAENYFPGILITDSHPENFTKDSMRILISLNQVKEKFDNIEQFFNLLTDFTTRKNDSFIEFVETNVNWLNELNKAVDLKPNFIGLGININSLLDLVINKKIQPIINK